VGGLLIQSAEEMATSARRSSTKTRIFVLPPSCLCFSSPKIKREMNKSRSLFHTTPTFSSPFRPDDGDLMDQKQDQQDQDQGSEALSLFD